MSKRFVFSVLILLLISCKGDNSQVMAEDTSSFEIRTDDWLKKTTPNGKTAEIIKEWEEFTAFQIGFDAIYNVGNTEDLSLVLEDLIEKQKTLAESKYPETFDKPQIKSRQKVLHTFILKAKGDLIYQIDSKKSVLEMIDAHNAMLVQMNAITSNTLDLKTLLEE